MRHILQRHKGKAVWLLFLFFIYLCVQTAWISDDAYISLRTVRNFVEGEGLRWNLHERVQSYTHPLWLLCLSTVYGLTHEAFFSTILFSLLVSISAVALLVFRLTKTQKGLVLLLLLSSKSFMDYTSSGLENPLSYLLLAAFGYVYLNGEFSAKRYFRLWLLTGLLFCNRIDAAMMLMPALALETLQHLMTIRLRAWGKPLALAVLGMLPFVLWTAFALIYYGFPFPNTAYAKLFTGISKQELLFQGVCYYLVLLFQDKLTFFTIVAAVFLAFYAQKQKLMMLALGILLYLAYILYIGGDFMAGRFFALPFWGSVLILAQLDLNGCFVRWQPVIKNALLGLLIIVLALSANRPTYFNTAAYESEDFIFGIADERGYYFKEMGLVPVLKAGQKESFFDYRRVGEQLAAYFPEKVAVTGTIGLTGFYADKDMKIVDKLALSDPLLARMKSPWNTRPLWRIGHIERFVPDGYLESLQSNQNRIQDSTLAQLYDKLRLITQAPIWSKQRWQTIWEYHSGTCKHLLGVSLPQNHDKLSATQLFTQKQYARLMDKKAALAQEIRTDSLSATPFLTVKDELFTLCPTIGDGLYEVGISLKAPADFSNDTLAKFELMEGVFDQFHELKTLYVTSQALKAHNGYISTTIPYGFSHFYLLATRLTPLKGAEIQVEFVRCKKVMEKYGQEK